MEELLELLESMRNGRGELHLSEPQTTALIDWVKATVAANKAFEDYVAARKREITDGEF